MQLINKSSVKKTFSHTWYLYPLATILITFIWLWGFQAFHQPSTHQSLSLFFATEMKNDSFTKKILEQYDREKLREIRTASALPNAVGYTTKLQLAINTGDLMIIDEGTLKDFDDHQENFFVELSNKTKEKYLKETYSYYSNKGKDYGILFKEKNKEHYLNNYMNFDENQNYYLVLLTGGNNLGDITSSENAPYDNALTIINKLIG